jgi:hypothetical protein
MSMVPCRLQKSSHSLLGHNPCLTEGKVGSLQGFQVFLQHLIVEELGPPFWGRV